MVSSRKRFLVWWFRSGISVRLVLFALVSFLLFTLVYWQRPLNENSYLPSNVAVFSLVNLNIAVLLVLVFLVARNFYQLIFERRRKILGSRLRLRLVGAIVGLTAIPAVLLIAVSSGLLSRAIDGWFSSPAETSVEAAKEIGKLYFSSIKDRTAKVAKSLSEELQSMQLTLTKEEDVKGFLERRRVAEELYGIEIFAPSGTAVVKVENATASIQYFSPPDPTAEDLKKAFSGISHVVTQETSSSQFIRALSPLAFSGERRVLVVTHRLRSEMSLALDTIRQSYQEYLQLKHFKNPLRSTYILSLYMIAGLVLFAAMWLGIHIAKQLTVPIQTLSEAMRDVAQGNFGRQVHHRGDDEIAFLTKSFNQMTTQLRDSTSQAERRRVYLETVLSNLAVGVIVIDTKGNVTAVNSAVLRILGKSEESAAYEGSMVETFLPVKVWTEVRSMVMTNDGTEQSGALQEKELLLSIDGAERRVLCTTGKLVTRSGEPLGSVLIIDDVTALSEAQRLAAWREAARRIAHEIKNPLTPIRLAAQRLNRSFSVEAPEGKVIHDATSTIVEHVDSIKRLVDEFSQFARMPKLQLKLLDLKPLVHEVVLSYVENEDGISFQSIVDDEIPEVRVDGEQIRRVLINLIDNAIRSLREEQFSLSLEQGEVRQPHESPKVIVKLYHDRLQARIVLEVCDNGPGVSEEDRAKIFEPYFTKRSGGTGLGLAIVVSIVSEHGGEVRILDFHPRGARFVISLPTSVSESTQRKLDLISPLSASDEEIA